MPRSPGPAWRQAVRRHELGQSRQLGEHLGVGDLHALGRPRGARGVDQRQHVTRGHRPPAVLEPEPRITGGHHRLQGERPGGLAVHAHHLLHRGAAAGFKQPRRELLLAHHHPAPGIAEHVADLLRGQGVVHRERRRPQVHRGGVGQVELGPVGHHQRHRVPRADTKPGQPGRDPPDLARVRLPGDRPCPARRPQRHLLPIPRRRQLEYLAHRGRRAQISHDGLPPLTPPGHVTKGLRRPSGKRPDHPSNHQAPRSQQASGASKQAWPAATTGQPAGYSEAVNPVPLSPDSTTLANSRQHRAVAHSRPIEQPAALAAGRNDRPGQYERPSSRREGKIFHEHGIGREGRLRFGVADTLCYRPWPVAAAARHMSADTSQNARDPRRDE